MRLPLLTSALMATAALVSVSKGAVTVYSTGFEFGEGTTLGAKLDGQLGWSVNNSAGNDDASYVINPGASWGRAATLGYTATVANSEVYVSHTAYDVPLDGSMFSVKFQVVDSVSDTSGVGRDTFGFRLENGFGDNLLSIFLTPFDQDPDPDTDTLFNTFSWSTGAGAATSVLGGFSAQESFAYTLSIAFSLSGANDISFLADVNGSQFSGVLAGLGAEDISTMGAFWDINNIADPGSNFLVFDDVTLSANVIPEPSVALLGLAGLGAGLLRRRRS
ncbi:PEP-CTERM sorting domain-containing protein [Luteolibacter marinus]|uniref:PEP-CTERM sorting domain-containing protein n=1 Tax=Luteolibacter marinus TaxID=2776705 RepID=UPI0018681249|nr:PEP-CTERM sorting domain-containing protein [Luteolibacter marinus]